MQNKRGQPVIELALMCESGKTWSPSNEVAASVSLPVWLATGLLHKSRDFRRKPSMPFFVLDFWPTNDMLIVASFT